MFLNLFAAVTVEHNQASSTNQIVSVERADTENEKNAIEAADLKAIEDDKILRANEKLKSEQNKQAFIRHQEALRKETSAQEYAQLISELQLLDQADKLKTQRRILDHSVAQTLKRNRDLEDDKNFETCGKSYEKPVGKNHRSGEVGQAVYLEDGAAFSENNKPTETHQDGLQKDLTSRESSALEEINSTVEGKDIASFPNDASVEKQTNGESKTKEDTTDNSEDSLRLPKYSDADLIKFLDQIRKQQDYWLRRKQARLHSKTDAARTSQKEFYFPDLESDALHQGHQDQMSHGQTGDVNTLDDLRSNGTNVKTVSENSSETRRPKTLLELYQALKKKTIGSPQYFTESNPTNSKLEKVRAYQQSMLKRSEFGRKILESDKSVTDPNHGESECDLAVKNDAPEYDNRSANSKIATITKDSKSSQTDTVLRPDVSLLKPQTQQIPVNLDDSSQIDVNDRFPISISESIPQAYFPSVSPFVSVPTVEDAWATKTSSPSSSGLTISSSASTDRVNVFKLLKENKGFSKMVFHQTAKKLEREGVLLRKPMDVNVSPKDSLEHDGSTTESCTPFGLTLSDDAAGTVCPLHQDRPISVKPFLQKKGPVHIEKLLSREVLQSLISNQSVTPSKPLNSFEEDIGTPSNVLLVSPASGLSSFSTPEGLITSRDDDSSSLSIASPFKHQNRSPDIISPTVSQQNLRDNLSPSSNANLNPVPETFEKIALEHDYINRQLEQVDQHKRELELMCKINGSYDSEQIIHLLGDFEGRFQDIKYYRKKPPPSLLNRNYLLQSRDISLHPHELSTIQEIASPEATMIQMTSDDEHDLNNRDDELCRAVEDSFCVGESLENLSLLLREQFTRPSCQTSHGQSCLQNEFLENNPDPIGYLVQLDQAPTSAVNLGMLAQDVSSSSDNTFTEELTRAQAVHTSADGISHTSALPATRLESVPLSKVSSPTNFFTLTPELVASSNPSSLTTTPNWSSNGSLPRESVNTTDIVDSSPSLGSLSQSSVKSDFAETLTESIRSNIESNQNLQSLESASVDVMDRNVNVTPRKRHPPSATIGRSQSTPIKKNLQLEILPDDEQPGIVDEPDLTFADSEVSSVVSSAASSPSKRTNLQDCYSTPEELQIFPVLNQSDSIENLRWAMSSQNSLFSSLMNLKIEESHYFSVAEHPLSPNVSPQPVIQVNSFTTDSPPVLSNFPSLRSGEEVCDVTSLSDSTLKNQSSENLSLGSKDGNGTSANDTLSSLQTVVPAAHDSQDYPNTDTGNKSTSDVLNSAVFSDFECAESPSLLSFQQHELSVMLNPGVTRLPGIHVPVSRSSVSPSTPRVPKNANEAANSSSLKESNLDNGKIFWVPCNEKKCDASTQNRLENLKEKRLNSPSTEKTKIPKLKTASLAEEKKSAIFKNFEINASESSRRKVIDSPKCQKSVILPQGKIHKKKRPDNEQYKVRTKRLWNNLEEVKKRNDKIDKKNQASINREKVKKFQEETLAKLTLKKKQ